MIIMRINADDVIRRYSPHNERQVRRALAATLNEAGAKAKTETARGITAKTGLQKGKAFSGGSVYQSRANQNKLHFAAVYRRAVPPLSAQRGRKSYAKTQRGRLSFDSFEGKRQVIHGVFKIKGKPTAYFIRDRNNKGKIRIVRAPSAKDYPDVRAAAEILGRRYFDSRLARNLRYFVGDARK